MAGQTQTSFRVVWTILVILGPLLVLALLGAVGGGALGTVELTLLPILVLSTWIVGLLMIWWPRRDGAPK